MKIAITGHRPPCCGLDWDGTGSKSQWVRHKIKSSLASYHLKNLTLISGMALGVDQIFAEIALLEDYNLIAAIPCKNHSCKWPRKSQDKYNKILNYYQCKKVLVNDVEYKPWVMQKRNEWMVDNCDILIAVYQPGRSGGTKNCIDYAKSKLKPIIYIDLEE